MCSYWTLAVWLARELISSFIYLINLNITSHVWLMAIILESIVLRVKLPRLKFWMPHLYDTYNFGQAIYSLWYSTKQWLYLNHDCFYFLNYLTTCFILCLQGKWAITITKCECIITIRKKKAVRVTQRSKWWHNSFLPSYPQRILIQTITQRQQCLMEVQESSKKVLCTWSKTF